MKKLRICMISSEFPPHAAGIGYAAYHVAKPLVDKGNKVTVFTRGNWRGGRTRMLDGITIHELPFIAFFPPFHILYHGFFINRLLKRSQKDFDLIHLHSPLIPVVNSDLPIITTVHSTWHSEAISFNKITDWYSLAVKLFKKSFIKYEDKLFSKSNMFITITGAMANELIRYYKINPLKISVIKNSIDIKKYKLIKKESSNNKQFKILSIGRLVYRKGVLDLVDAAKIICHRYPNVVFTIIGEGPLEKSLREKIKEYRLQNNVLLVGAVPNNQIKKYIKASSVFVIPSYYEGLPLVLLEAIASGKPVIGTNIDGIKEIIKDGKNGLLVPSGNPRSIAKAIIQLFKNPTLRIILGKNARKTAEQFDRKLMINKILKIYENLDTKNSMNKRLYVRSQI
ncbi:MAG: glycosyltransferase family 4 protein [Patescibacteria group bacterium]|nr:glycosyltransferase family 4 protein [Patescibacteria group bacterium]